MKVANMICEGPEPVDTTSYKGYDPVNNPEHYTNGGIKCFDAIVASQGREAAKDFCLCNAFKYIWRCKHKGNSLEDIEKAIWYLNKYVDIYCRELDHNES